MILFQGDCEGETNRSNVLCIKRELTSHALGVGGMKSGVMLHRTEVFFGYYLHPPKKT